MIELHLVRVGGGKSAVIVGVATIRIGLLWMLLLLLIGERLLLLIDEGLMLLIDEGLLLRIEDELLEFSCCHLLKTRQKRMTPGVLTSRLFNSLKGLFHEMNIFLKANNQK
jgi:hypothetical protein